MSERGRSDSRRRVWKWEFAAVDEFTIQMPKGSVVVAVDQQYGRPVLWADVDIDQPGEPRRFLLRGTGQEIPTEAHYLGSFQLHAGQFVGHLYEP